MNTLTLPLVIGWISLTATACAPVDNAVGKEHSTSVGGAAAGGTGSGGAGTSTGGASTSTGGASTTVGGSSSCDDYAVPTDGHTVEVIVKNERSTAVYLNNGDGGPCAEAETISIYDANGVKHLSGGDCPCEMTTGFDACPAFSCKPPALLRVEANSSLKLMWYGTYRIQTIVPSACTVENAAAFECQQAIPAPAGTYKLVVNGSTDWQCPADSSCLCDATNGCVAITPGAIMIRAGKLLEPSVTFDLYRTDSVTVTFADGMENP